MVTTSSGGKARKSLFLSFTTMFISLLLIYEYFDVRSAVRYAANRAYPWDTNSSDQVIEPNRTFLILDWTRFFGDAALDRLDVSLSSQICEQNRSMIDFQVSSAKSVPVHVEPLASGRI